MFFTTILNINKLERSRERKETRGLTSFIKKYQTTRHPNLPTSSNSDIKRTLRTLRELSAASLSIKYTRTT